MKLYRNSSQKAHRMMAESPPSATGVRDHYGPLLSYVNVQLGYESPLINYYLRLTPSECRALASELVAEADKVEERG